MRINQLGYALAKKPATRLFAMAHTSNYKYQTSTALS